MKYLLIIAADPAVPSPGPGDEGFEEYMKAWFAYDHDLSQAGVLVGGEALQPVETATTVRHDGGATTVIDGPFVELKEHLGGYYLIDVDTLDDAIAWARKVPVGTGAIEVRPIMPMGPDS